MEEDKYKKIVLHLKEGEDVYVETPWVVDLGNGRYRMEIGIHTSTILSFMGFRFLKRVQRPACAVRSRFQDRQGDIVGCL